MSIFWSGYIILLVVITLLICCFVLMSCTKQPLVLDAKNTTGHSYDGIEEFNNPLPRWWMWLFWMTVVIGIIYLMLYPGLGKFKGMLNWTSQKQYNTQRVFAKKEYEPIFKKYYKEPIVILAKDPKAMQIAQRLFANNCAGCHGINAQGAVGFPNLTDDDWLHGGTPEIIETTILNGRTGIMPPMGQAIGGEEGIAEVTAYIRSLNGFRADQTQLVKGLVKFQTVCAACHGQDARGNTAIGAPNLANNIWLYGRDEETISETIRNGRSGQMPAQKEKLGVERVHLLAAYVYSLSHNP